MSTSTTDRRGGFTDEQRRSVTTRGVSVSLAAGAGCGKTLVLTERFLSHFDPRQAGAITPDEIGQLVAITFTDRAAREMRDRIRASCHRRLQTALDRDASYWADMLRALDTARISTIHSYCASLLRSRAVEAGIDPHFSVLQQAQAETLLAEAIDDELRRLVSAADEKTIELAVRFNLHGLREMVRRLVVECTPEDFRVWLAVSPDDQVALWEASASELTPVLGQRLAESAAAQTALEVMRDKLPDNATMRSRATALSSALEHLREGPANSDALAQCLEIVEANARVERAGGRGCWPTPEAYGRFRDAAAELRKAAGKLRMLSGFDPANAREAAVLGGQLLAVADGVSRAYSKRKDELRAMDFDDLLVRARALLTAEQHRNVIRRVSSAVMLLLVDEFQDTDPLQAQLIQTLAGEGLRDGKLFFVGDHKQSIYRFRGADPRVFHRLREQTPESGRQSLSLNFRSQPEILHFVNALFWDDLGADYEPLRPHRAQVGPVPAVEFLWAHGEQSGSGSGKPNVEALRRREADWIARRIRVMLDSGEPIVWDAEAVKAGAPAARAARLGDIAVLLRALTDVEAYEAALRHYEIDYYLVGGHAFYAQQEIFDLLNLLRALNSPADVVSLVGALRSGFFALADETIFWLSLHPDGISAGLFAEEFPQQLSEDQQQRVAFAASTISQLRDCKDRLRISELIECALSLTGYDATLLAEFLGERKLANLLKLQEQARAFQGGDFLSLADFIAQLAEFVVRQPDEPLAATHSEDTDVVRLMSVHQAKGLEFPIVIVPDVNRKQPDPWAPARFDPRLGPLVRLQGTHDAISGYDLWRHFEKSEEAAEAIRLLYVAATRAADYLILSSGVGTVGEANGPWAQLLARRFDLASGRFRGHLPHAEPIPAVKVTLETPSITRPSARRPRKMHVDQLLAELELAAAAPGIPPQARTVDPIPADTAARRQYSFSRLEGTLHRKYRRLDDAEYMGQSAYDPRSLGTLVHAALAALDFAAPADCRHLVECLAEQHLPEKPAEVDEAVVMVSRFVTSPRAREIAAAAESHAEVEFLLNWPPDAGNSGDIVLRGFIDRLYQDAAGRWHLLDFKTNRVTGTNIARQAASYEMQMLVYGLAAQRILGAPPASLTLHFLRTGAEHQFAWNDASRPKAIALVEDAIEAQRPPQSADR